MHLKCLPSFGWGMREQSTTEYVLLHLQIMQVFKPVSFTRKEFTP